MIRIIPDSCGLQMYEGSWEVPPVFPFLQRAGNVADTEMKRAFNNGIGLIAVVTEKAADEILDRLKGMDERAFLVGEVIKRPQDDERITWIESDEFKVCR